MAVSLYSEGVMSNERIAAFLNAAGNDELGLSEGSVYGFCQKQAKVVGTSLWNLEEELLDQKVVATDATTVTVNGVQNYIRNFSTGQTVVFRKDSGHEMYYSILSVIETSKEKKNGNARKYKKTFYGYTGYFLAGVMPSGSNERLNCYKTFDYYIHNAYNPVFNSCVDNKSL